MNPRLPKFAKGKFNPKFPEKYIGLKTPTYRSSWEQAFMRLCDEHPNVAKWASESIKIPYRHPFTGKYTVYVPDFFIVYMDKNGRKHAEMIEVKPSDQMTMERAGKSQAKKNGEKRHRVTFQEQLMKPKPSLILFG